MLTLREYPEIEGESAHYLVENGETMVLMTDRFMVVAEVNWVRIYPRRDADSEWLRSQPWYRNWVVKRMSARGMVDLVDAPAEDRRGDA